MNKNYETDIVDMFELMSEEAEERRPVSGVTISPDEALLNCLNSLGGVDIGYISELSGLPAEKVVSELRGAIFQNPEQFADGKPYDIESDWMISSRYLSGNVGNKLEIAKRAEKKYPGKFSANIEKLKSILPEKVGIDDIHIALGATWIPPEEVALFIADFFKLKECPEVCFYSDLLMYKINPTKELCESVLNTMTYGVRGEVNSYGSNYSKQYLTAVDIIEQTMNAKTVKVYDYVPKKGSYIYDYEPVLNRNKTVEAQNKQKKLIDAFRDYVYADRARVVRFEQYYNDRLVGYTYSQYDGSFLKLSDLNPQVTLHKHQRDAIARILVSGNNILLAHNVGAGKTYIMISALHELYRMNISKKNLMVVPNNVLKATVDAHKYLYPDDKILAVYPKDFDRKNRNRILEQIRDNDYVAVYMACSSFDMVVMSKTYYVEKMKREIDELRTAMYNANIRHEKCKIKSKKEALEKKLAKYIDEALPCPWLTYDKLGITTLVVVEAHNYKNIPISTNAEGIVGMGGSSKKCAEMLEKAHFTERLVFATGTPLTNSLADLFTLQTYLQPATLEYHGISTFDFWVNTFGKREVSIELDISSDSRNLRTMTRFSSFHNLSELMCLFSQVCDFYYLEGKEEGLPAFHGYENICVKRSRALAEYVKALSERTDKIRSKDVKRTEDNLLKITTDGRLAALDMRLVDTDIPYDYGCETKVEACADKLTELYHKYPGFVQIVFSDIGTPKSKFNIYDALADELVKRGMPGNEIAFVHDATTENARAKLFKDMNKGVVRVVVGSTQKLGVGVNVMEKLVALHHLSIPWRPADLVQREGRILRAGNTSPEVFIYRYITEGSFDAFSWQLLENKARFIQSFLSASSTARDADDISDTVLTYSEVKALAIGNPLIKHRVEVANKLERTKIACRGRQREIQQLNSVIAAIPEKLVNLKKLSDTARYDYAYYTDIKEHISNEERIAFGEELLTALYDNIDREKERIFDEYQGFSVILPAGMSRDKSHVILMPEFGGRYYCDIDLESKTPLGCTKSIDYVLDHLGERAERLNTERELVKKQLAEAEEDLKRENPYYEEVEKLKEELDAIDCQLEADAKANTVTEV